MNKVVRLDNFGGLFVLKVFFMTDKPEDYFSYNLLACLTF